MQWTEVRIHTSNEAMEAISNILHDFDVGGFVIEDPLDLMKERETFFGEIYELDPGKYPKTGIFMKFYLPKDKFQNDKIEKIKEAINRLHMHDIDLGANQLKLEEVDEEDWSTAWKKYYKPTKVTENIIIVPTWEGYKSDSNNELVIELDPGMAFGTGTHPTTILSIQALEKYMKKNDLVLDVGCGSGILSIAAGLLGADSVYAFDLDKVAVNSTVLNLELNKLSNKVVTQQNNLLENVHEKANIIVTNILAEIIITFIDDAWNNLKQDGIFITSGIIQKKKQTVVDHLQDVGFDIIEITEMEGWVTIIAKKV